MSESAERWFPTDLGHTSTGFVTNMRASLSAEIVKHCALVAGVDDGEDSAGRARVGLMPASQVAERAADIADALVAIWETRGWIRPTTMTEEEDWRHVGQLHSIKSKAEYARVADELGMTKSQRP